MLGSWPSAAQWIPIKRGGLGLSDAPGDGKPAGTNVVGSESQPAFYFYNDGSRFHIRERLNENPLVRNGSGAPELVQFGWSLLILPENDFSHYKYSIQLDAGGTSDKDRIELQHNTKWGRAGDPSDQPEVTMNVTGLCYAWSEACEPNVAVSVACDVTDPSAKCFAGEAGRPDNDFFLDFWIPTEWLPAEVLEQPVRVLGTVGSSDAGAEIDIAGVDGTCNGVALPPGCRNCLECGSSDPTLLGAVPAAGDHGARTHSRSTLHKPVRERVLGSVHAQALATLARLMETPATTPTAFDVGVPRTLADLFDLVRRFNFVSDETVLAALVYMQRAHAAGLQLNSVNTPGVFLAALLLAHKFLADVPYDNLSFARLGGITVGQTNELEAHLLTLLEYDLMVEADELDAHDGGAGGMGSPLGGVGVAVGGQMTRSRSQSSRPPLVHANLVHEHALDLLNAAGRVAPSMVSAFDGVVPGRPLREWFDLISAHHFVSDDTVLAALVYLQRAQAAGLEMNAATVRPVFLGALLLAHKMLADQPYGNEDFSVLGGVALSDLKAVEMQLLAVLGFDLLVEPSELSGMAPSGYQAKAAPGAADLNNHWVPQTASRMRTQSHSAVAVSNHVHAQALAAVRGFGSVVPTAASGFDRIVPRRPLGQWFELIQQYKIVSDETVLAALVYLQRAQAAGLELNAANAQSVFLAALTLAHKFLADVPFDNLTFARLAEVTLAQANAAELELLAVLQFDVAVDVAQLAAVAA
eukprot:TRINITY_DN1155_c0_g1_i1.p1 TRINITY_DN1155_c0_g1~~TRINITY_DN1155_c0_g1_i1.p1  ORF type:complete len:775 (+),score=221.73 TRINITY_DN1155_c0_g1_i1:68-2326(+)